MLLMAPAELSHVAHQAAPRSLEMSPLASASLQGNEFTDAVAALIADISAITLLLGW